jgi:hypothetical protein
MTTETIPSDLVAVYDNSWSQWWLYYISTDSKIKFIGGPKDGQVEDAENNPPYTTAEVNPEVFGVPKPKSGNSQLGVAEYLDNSGKPQVCVLGFFGFSCNLTGLADPSLLP